MTLIPDPTDDRAPAIVADEHGTRLAPVVCWAPVGTSPLDTEKWRPVGWLTEPFSPAPEREDHT